MTGCAKDRTRRWNILAVSFEGSVSALTNEMTIISLVWNPQPFPWQAALASTFALQPKYGEKNVSAKEYWLEHCLELIQKMLRGVLLQAETGIDEQLKLEHSCRHFWGIVFWCLPWHFTGLECMVFPVTSCTCKQLCIAGQMLGEVMTLPWVTAATKFLVGCGGNSWVQPAKWTAREQRKSALLRAPWGLKKWLFSLESTLTLAFPRAYPKDASWSLVASHDMFCKGGTAEAGTFLPKLFEGLCFGVCTDISLVCNAWPFQ